MLPAAGSFAQNQDIKQVVDEIKPTAVINELKQAELNQKNQIFNFGEEGLNLRQIISTTPVTGQFEIQAGGVVVPTVLEDPSESKPQTTQQLAVTEQSLSIRSVEEDPDFENRSKRLVTGPSQYDSRIETRLLNPLIPWQLTILLNGESVGIIVEKSSLTDVGDSTYHLDIGVTLGKRFNLCPGEAFENQPVVGIGTAFVLDDSTMVTAGHVFSENPERYAVVFGFEISNLSGRFTETVPAGNVFFPKQQVPTTNDLDIAFFRVDRPLGRRQLPVGYSRNLPPNTPVYMIGHPSGLPQKVALNASIRENLNLSYFITTLDAFQGNSGSPVFRLDTHEVIGVLVSGVNDFRWTGQCNVSEVCRIPYCPGEKVIRLETLVEVIQKN